MSNPDFRDEVPAWAQYAINTDGSSDKFYEVRIDLGDDGTYYLTKRWGRRPDTGAGQIKVEQYATMNGAQSVAHSQMVAKTQRGYYLVDRPITANAKVLVADSDEDYDDEDY